MGLKNCLKKPMRKMVLEPVIGCKENYLLHRLKGVLTIYVFSPS